MIYANSYAALRDESYGIIQRAVDDMLKDRELREEIEYHARMILEAIAKSLRAHPRPRPRIRSSRVV